MKVFRLIVSQTPKLLIIVVLACIAASQTFTGRITGRVLDSQQAAVIGASVTLRSVETGFERRTLTNAQGEYTFELVPPGKFKVTSEKNGFTPTALDVEVAVAVSVRADVTLHIRRVAERLQVFGGSGVSIQTDNANLGGVISNRQISELPSLGRSLYDFIALVPGAALSNDAIGVGYAVNGGRTQSANYLVDGSEDNDIMMSAPAMDVPLDSIQEFNIQTGHLSAEYGRNSGFTANIVTKSGTNQFHGSIYDYVRNSAFAANTFDNNANGLSRPVFNRHQFGGTAGGPVSNNLFFFISTEAIRVRSSGPNTFYVPTPQLVAMSAPGTEAIFERFPLPVNVSSSNVRWRLVCPFAASCNSQTASGFVSIPAFAFTSRIGPQDFGAGAPQNTILGTGRLDWIAGGSMQAFVRYAIENKDEFALAFQPYSSKLDQPLYGHNQNVSINVIRTWSPKVVTESRLAYARVTGDPDRFGGDGYSVPQPLFPSFSILTEDVSLPFGTPSTFGPTNVYQFFQTATYSHGNHVLRFGGEFVHLRQNVTFGLPGEVADAQFANTQDFVDGFLQSFAIALDPKGKFPGEYVDPPFGPPDFRHHYHYNEPSLFGEDSWKLTPRITLTPGLRWEYFGVFHTPGSEHKLDSNFYPGAGTSLPERIANGQMLRTINAPGELRGHFYLPSFHDFAPRFGLACDLFGNGKTVLRTGGGLFYDRSVGWELFRAYQNPPAYNVSKLVDLMLTPEIVKNQYAAFPNKSVQLAQSAIFAPDTHLRSAYTAAWNTTLEHEVRGTLVLGASYLGSSGSRLYALNRVNRNGSGGLLDPSCITDRIAADGLTAIGPDYSNCPRLYPNATTIILRGNEGHSSYHALQLRLDGRRISNLGLQFGANYSWSHSIDNRSVSGLSASVADTGTGYLDAFNPALDRASSDFDARHRIAGHFIWELPITRNSQRSFASFFLRGWEASGFLSYQTGQPFGLADFATPDALDDMTRPRLTGPLPYTGKLVTDLVSPNNYLYLPMNQVYDPLSRGCIANAAPFACEISVNGPFEDMMPRNVFRQPGLFFFNTALLKNLVLDQERLKLQLRVEFYNALNHANLYIKPSSVDVGTYSFTDQAGTFVPGVTAGFRDNRQVVVAAKLFF